MFYISFPKETIKNIFFLETSVFEVDKVSDNEQ